MSEFSHLRNKLLAEQVEDQIYHYLSLIHISGSGGAKTRASLHKDGTALPALNAQNTQLSLNKEHFLRQM